jgi:hypothetical protein
VTKLAYQLPINGAIVEFENQRKGRKRMKAYQEIISRIQDANEILILGPGEAKTEIKKELEKSRELALKKVTVKPADKMTERQTAARVRQFFLRNKTQTKRI